MRQHIVVVAIATPMHAFYIRNQNQTKNVAVCGFVEYSPKTRLSVQTISIFATAFFLKNKTSEKFVFPFWPRHSNRWLSNLSKCVHYEFLHHGKFSLCSELWRRDGFFEKGTVTFSPLRTGQQTSNGLHVYFMRKVNFALNRIPRSQAVAENSPKKWSEELWVWRTTPQRSPLPPVSCVGWMASSSVMIW